MSVGPPAIFFISVTNLQNTNFVGSQPPHTAKIPHFVNCSPSTTQKEPTISICFSPVFWQFSNLHSPLCSERAWISKYPRSLCADSEQPTKELSLYFHLTPLVSGWDQTQESPKINRGIVDRASIVRLRSVQPTNRQICRSTQILSPRQNISLLGRLSCNRSNSLATTVSAVTVQRIVRITTARCFIYARKVAQFLNALNVERYGKIAPFTLVANARAEFQTRVWVDLTSSLICPME